MNMHEGSGSKDAEKDPSPIAEREYFILMSMDAKIENPLPPLMTSEEEAIAEALRRSREMSSDPTIGISLRDFDRRIRQRR